MVSGSLIVIVMVAMVAMATAAEGTYLSELLAGVRLETMETREVLGMALRAAAKGLSGCSAPGCRLEGQSCKGSVLTSGPVPACTQDCCAIGTQCVNNKCQNNNLGSKCQNDHDCFTALAHGVCINQKCFSLNLPGDSCVSDQQCVGSATCNSSKLCQGLATGVACSTSLECGFGDYCAAADSVCRALGGRDALCVDSDECQYGFLCGEGVCEPQLSRKKGEVCTTSGRYWEQECQV